MAGHSQFKNIMYRKGAQDAKRAKIFTKLAKEIVVAAKSGLPEPEMNPRLRAAILAARAANNGAYPPDLSLIAKARAVERGFPWFVFDAFTQYQEQGVDYIHALLTGYHEAPEGVTVPEGQYYNPNFIAGESLAMAPPLSDEAIEYSDGTPMTVDQYARDVAAFLMWTAEPKLEQRKLMGFRVMAFLLIFASLLFFTKKKLWRNVEH